MIFYKNSEYNDLPIRFTTKYAFFVSSNTSDVGRNVVFHQNLDDCLILPSEEKALQRNADLLKVKQFKTKGKSHFVLQLALRLRTV